MYNKDDQKLKQRLYEIELYITQMFEAIYL